MEKQISLIFYSNEEKISNELNIFLRSFTDFTKFHTAENFMKMQLYEKKTIPKKILAQSELATLLQTPKICTVPGPFRHLQQ